MPMPVHPRARCRDFHDLQVFQKARELASETIRVTEHFPKSEIYGSVSQMRRAVISIASNIAEGYRRCSRREHVKFLKIALGSCGELDAQFLIASDAGWIPPGEYSHIKSLLSDVSRWTWRLIESLEKQRSRPGNQGG